MYIVGMAWIFVGGLTTDEEEEEMIHRQRPAARVGGDRHCRAAAGESDGEMKYLLSLSDWAVVLLLMIASAGDNNALLLLLRNQSSIAARRVLKRKR